MNTPTATPVSETEHRLNFLEETISGYKVLIDTCTLLHRPYRLFFKHAAPFLKKHGQQIYIARAVVNELRKYPQKAAGKQKDAAAAKAAEVERDLAAYQQEGLICLCGDPNDSAVGDAVFLSAVTKLRTRYNVMLISQDGDLLHEVDKLNQSDCVRGLKKVRVRRLNREGFLVRPKGVGVSSDDGASQSCSSSAAAAVLPLCGQPFAKGGVLKRGKGELLRVTEPPAEGNSLVAETPGGSRRVTLGKRLGGGGEGDVYETDTPLVAKIYKPECNTAHKRDKLQLLLAHGVACKGVCFPQALLYNNKHEFLGYLMPRAQGHELQSLFSKPLLQKYFPTWKKEDLVQLCLTILQKVEYLHRMNIILGDINANNILAVSPTEVYFVDTDSYQVENFPCPVGQELYTAPELQGKNYADFLRTPQQERFALAVLLFMVLMLGKHPYSRQGGGAPAENIRRGMFPYAAGELKSQNTPQGDWVYMWSHLSRAVKDAFHAMFHKDGARYAPDTRLTAAEWMKLLVGYQKGLQNGMLNADPMSNDLYPTRHKRSADTPMAPCRHCGKSVLQTELKQGFCPECYGKAKTVHCLSCGSPILALPNAKGEMPRFCYACSSWAREPKLQRKCSCCNKSFVITNGEYEYFLFQNLCMPKKCKDCRSKAAVSVSRSSCAPRYTRYSVPSYTPKPTTYAPKPTTHTPPYTPPTGQQNGSVSVLGLAGKAVCSVAKGAWWVAKTVVKGVCC